MRALSSPRRNSRRLRAGVAGALGGLMVLVLSGCEWLLRSGEEAELSIHIVDATLVAQRAPDGRVEATLSGLRLALAACHGHVAEHPGFDGGWYGWSSCGASGRLADDVDVELVTGTATVVVETERRWRSPGTDGSGGSGEDSFDRDWPGETVATVSVGPLGFMEEAVLDPISFAFDDDARPFPSGVTDVRYGFHVWVVICTVHNEAPVGEREWLFRNCGGDHDLSRVESGFFFLLDPDRSPDVDPTGLGLPDRAGQFHRVDVVTGGDGAPTAPPGAGDGGSQLATVAGLPVSRSVSGLYEGVAEFYPDQGVVSVQAYFHGAEFAEPLPVATVASDGADLIRAAFPDLGIINVVYEPDWTQRSYPPGRYGGTLTCQGLAPVRVFALVEITFACGWIDTGTVGTVRFSTKMHADDEPDSVAVAHAHDVVAELLLQMRGDIQGGGGQ
jgi:hypothetical protein